MSRMIAAAFVSGALFAAGLTLGGMTSPSKVIGFLDIFGTWDPSLAFVMGGAVVTYAAVFHLVRPGLSHPLFAAQFELPSARDLDPRLIGGAALFGVGWGMGGVCPGPALTSLGTGGVGVLIFVAAMLVAMRALPGRK